MYLADDQPISELEKVAHRRGLLESVGIRELPWDKIILVGGTALALFAINKRRKKRR